MVLRALAKSPEKRYQQASEVRLDVERITGNERTAQATPTRKMPFQDSFECRRRNLPHDAHDFVLSVVGSLVALTTWYLIPMTLLIALLNLVVSSWPTLMSVVVGVSVAILLFLIAIAIMALQSVNKLVLDPVGIHLNRYLGPTELVPWSDITNVTPLPAAIQCA